MIRFMVTLVWGALVAVAAAAEVSSPVEPSDTLKLFQLDPGLAIELVAAEPEVIDPIAIRFDEDGRLWVVEMRDYPHGPAEGQPPMSKIRVLTDADGDGRYETSRVFAEQLLFPTGLQPWQGGVIVTLAGEVAYLKDTDGDGRSDIHQPWYYGFTQGNPQLRANHPRLGPDHRVYIANGLTGGTVFDPRRPDARPVSISGRDFRFDPRTGDCEAISGNGQFGLTFDDNGNRFVCSNRNPLDQIVLEGRYLARNPLLAVSAVQHAVAAPDEASRVFPLTRAWTTSNLHAGQFTAACGIDIYRGDALPKEYYGSSLTCEPTGSLVHREILSPEGATFAARPANENREFLASPDAWFRPVNLEVGPDGALYVVDIYRAVIEHPQYMPAELQQRPDQRLGDDRGRIYRIVPRDSKRKSNRPSLSNATSRELVALLDHANVWWRETAARLLYERQDKQAVADLRSLATTAKLSSGRILALAALDGLSELDEKSLLAALADTDPRVREQAVLLSETRLGDESLRTKVCQLASDDDPHVAFRVALAVGGLPADEARAPLVAIAIRHRGDEWMRRAVSTTLPANVPSLLVAILEKLPSGAAEADASAQALVDELSAIVGAGREPGEIVPLLSALCTTDATAPPIRDAALLGLAEGMERRGSRLAEFVAAQDASLAAKLDALFARAATESADEKANETDRLRQLALLRHARGEGVVAVCMELAQTSPHQSLRIAAIEALSPQADLAVAETLLAGYGAQSPSVRRAIHDALIDQPEAAQFLLAAVEAKELSRADLGAACENRLREHRDEEIRKLAAKLLSNANAAERQAVLAAYRPILEQPGDPEAGKPLFRQHCASCHKIGDLGVDVAPDISDSRVKTHEQLLTDILNPNQAIDNNYVSYSVVMADGTVHTGLISAETPTSITLRQQENKTLTLLRADIEAIRSAGVSLMPEGFEKHLSHEQMADLISFVKNWRYLIEPIPGTLGAE